MSSRPTLIALGLAAGLGLVYWGWVYKVKPARDKSKEDGKLVFQGLDAASTSEIKLRKKGSADVLLRKVDGRWRLITPTAAPADEDAVATLAKELASAKRNEIIVEKDADQREFGLDQPSGAVTFQPASPGAKPLVLYFGMDNPLGDQAYGMVDGKPEVFLTYLTIKNAVLKDAAALRDKAVWSFDPAQVEGAHSPQGWTLSRDKQGQWQVDSKDGKETAKGALVDGWLAELSRLKAESVPSETGKGSFGLGSGKRLTLTLKNGQAISLLRGGKAKPNGFYVQVAGQGPVYQMGDGTALSLDKRAQDLADRNAFKLETAQTEGFQIQLPTGSLKAAKGRDGKWAWDPPRPAKAGEPEFDFTGFISKFANAQLLKRLSKESQVTGNAGTVTFTTANGVLLESARIGDAMAGGRAAWSKGKQQAVVVASNLLDSLPPVEAKAAVPAASGTPPAAPKPAPLKAVTAAAGH